MIDFTIPLYPYKFQSYISNHSEIIQVARNFWRTLYIMQFQNNFLSIEKIIGIFPIVAFAKKRIDM